MSDILLALDSGNLALLALLDLTAAFDSVDHVTLLSRLHKSYGLDDVLSWFSSYLTCRTYTQYFRTSATNSDPSAVFYGVAQVWSLDRSCLSYILQMFFSW